MKPRICSVCQLYFPTAAEVIRHGKATHINSKSNDSQHKEEMEVELEETDKCDLVIIYRNIFNALQCPWSKDDWTSLHAWLAVAKNFARSA